MKTTKLFTALRNSFLTLVTACVAISPLASFGADAPAAAADKDGWQPLLDEKLTQWEPWLGPPSRRAAPIGLRDTLGIFTVRMENGEPILHISGQIQAGLTTKKEYSNYRLRAQFRWGEKRWKPRLNAPRDNGILYHCIGEHGAFYGVWMRSVEYQIQEKDIGEFWPLCGTQADFPAVQEGKLWRYTPGAPLKTLGQQVMHGTDYYEKPNGEWNDLELVVSGDSSKHILNGRVVNELFNISYAEGQGENRKVVPITAGKLQIQSEYAEAEFRRVEIKQIPPVEKKNERALTAPPRVLVFSKTNGYRHHDAIAKGKVFFKKLGETHGFETDITEDAAVFTDENLKKYAAIVLLCTAGEFTMDVPPKKAAPAQKTAAKEQSKERREAFRRYIANGGALVALHSAIDNFQTDGEYWTEYARIIGGDFQHHPKHQTSVINIVDRSHPSTKHLKGATITSKTLPAVKYDKKDSWVCFDEWYSFKTLQRDNQILLTVDDSTCKDTQVSHYENGEKCGIHPFAWTRTYGKGNVFFTARGHYGAAFNEPEYARHVIGALYPLIGLPLPPATSELPQQ